MIIRIDFDTILPIWKNGLWPGREAIKPISHMQYLEQEDVMIPKDFKPTFLAYLVKGRIAGVNSGHASSETHYRSRGLYVDPAHRRQGIAKSLLMRTVDQARMEGKSHCWSLPRKESIDAYVCAGFEKASEYFKTETSEQNCYVIMKL